MFFFCTYIKCFFSSKTIAIRYTILFFLFFISETKAQDSLVIIKGKVMQDITTGFSDMLIVNMTKGTGVYGNLDGTFQITAHKNDLIKISCRGYKTASISMQDSVLKAEYFVAIKLSLLEIIQQEAVIIRPTPTLEDLKKSQSEVGTYQYRPLLNSPLEMFFSPITAIYQLFSKREAEKQKYAMFMSQKQLDDYLVGVTRYLMKSGLIDLTEEEMPRFIARCPISEDFAKEASLYEVSTVLNSCYKEYAKRHKVERY